MLGAAASVVEEGTGADLLEPGIFGWRKKRGERCERT